MQSSQDRRQSSQDKKIWLFDESMLTQNVLMSPSQPYTPTSYSPDTFYDGDALRPGGAIPLLSRASIGLVMQYVAVGMIYGMIPALLYPVYLLYLNFEGYEAASYSVLVSLCWSLKVVLGMFSDCFPILGYKRKPYIVLGWTVALVAIVVMTVTPFPEPFLGHDLGSLPREVVREVRDGNFTRLTDAQKSLVNLNTVSQASLWIFLSCVASFGYMLADVAADALVVQYSQREPLEIRGRFQSVIYGTRFAANVLPNAVLGFCVNGKPYGGDFSWYVTPNTIYGLLVIPCVLAIASALLWIDEAREPRVPVAQYLRQLWHLLKLRVMWQICAFRFLSNLFFNFDSTASLPISRTWAEVRPVTNSWYTVCAVSAMAATIFSCGRWGLQWNWRWTIAITTTLVVAIDACMMLCTTWDVFRNQYLYVGGLLSSTLPFALRWIIAAYCAVEIADVGNEGAVNALVTSIVNLADPFSSVLYKAIDSYFPLIEKLKDDTTEVRMQVTYTLVLAFTMKMLSLGWLVLLPSQKAAVQLLKRRGGSSAAAAIALLIVYVLALSFSVTTNVMSLLESTRCYRIAGGDGKQVVVNGTVVC